MKQSFRAWHGFWGTTGGEKHLNMQPQSCGETELTPCNPGCVVYMNLRHALCVIHIFGAESQGHPDFLFVVG